MTGEESAHDRRGRLLSRRGVLGLGVALAAAGCTGRSGAAPQGTTGSAPVVPAPPSPVPASPMPESPMPAGPLPESPVPSTPASTPVTRPELPRPPLASTVVSMWMNTFAHPTIAELPTDVRGHTTQLVFAIAQSAQAGTGLLRWAPSVQTPQQVADDIAGYVQGGKPVLLGIGGSDDGGITLTNAEQVDEFCGSVQALVQQYGFTGIDLDLEPSGGSWDEISVHAVTTRLKTWYGNTFLIGLTVGLYAEFTARWLSLSRVLGASYDYWAPMLYDFPQARDDQLTPVALDMVKIAVAGGVPAAKQVLGFMCNSAVNSSPVAVTGRAVQSVTKTFPTIRGAYIWESKLELAADYQWTRNVGKRLSQNL